MELMELSYSVFLDALLSATIRLVKAMTGSTIADARVCLSTSKQDENAYRIHIGFVEETHERVMLEQKLQRLAIEYRVLKTNLKLLQAAEEQEQRFAMQESCSRLLSEEVILKETHDSLSDTKWIFMRQTHWAHLRRKSCFVREIWSIIQIIERTGLGRHWIEMIGYSSDGERESIADR